MPVVPSASTMQYRLRLNGIMEVKEFEAPRLGVVRTVGAIEKKDRWKGKVYLSQIDIDDMFSDFGSVLLVAWVTGTDTEEISAKLDFKDEKIKVNAEDLATEGEGIDLYFRDNDTRADYRLGTIISRRKNPEPAPVLSIQFYHVDSKSANQYVGNLYIDLGNSASRRILVSNNPLNHYMKKYDSPLYIGSIQVLRVEGSFPESPLDRVKRLESSQMVFEEVTVQGTYKIVDNYTVSSDYRVQQSHIAINNGLIPRPAYYAIYRNFLNVTVEWLWAQVDFSFRLGGINPDKFEVPDSLTRWNYCMHHIIRAFTFFVTRFRYSFDSYDKGNCEHPLATLSCETYSGPVINLEGRYDCEDGAWWLKCILSITQDVTDKELEKSKLEPGEQLFFKAIRSMLRQYVCTTALVTATSPKMKPAVDVSDGGESDHSEIYYHMTCCLLPARQFIRSVRYGNPAKDSSEEAIESKWEFTELDLNLLFAESTANFFSDPEMIFETFDINKFNDITENEDILCIPIFENYKTGNRGLVPTIVKFICFYTDFFYKPSVKSDVRDTVFYVRDESNNTLVMSSSEMITMPKKLRLVHTCKMDKWSLFLLEGKVKAATPSTLLMINRDLYVEAARKCFEKFKPIGPFDGWFETSETRTEYTGQGPACSYVPWNLTNIKEPSELEVAKGYYIVKSPEQITSETGA